MDSRVLRTRLLIALVAAAVATMADHGLHAQPATGAGALAAAPRALPEKPRRTVLRPVDDPRHIEVKFLDHLSIGVDGAPFDRGQKGLRTAAAQLAFGSISAAGGSWRRMPGASEAEVDRLREHASRNLGRPVANLNNYFIVTVPPGADAAPWIDLLNALPEVEMAKPLPLPVRSPVPVSFQGRQGYLTAAGTGIDASYAWSVGDSGQNVTICDFEYSWNLSHQDLPAGIQTLLPPGWTASDPFANNNHGTAVLGELASKNNGWGTTGASYGSSIVVAPTYLNLSWEIGTAMTYAMTQLQPGDIFLIEQQIGGPRYKGLVGNDTGLVPIEWWQSWYDVVVTAVGNGFHVVEAGGNGYQDLDSAVYRTGNGGHWPFQPLNNSGAIIVGAGAVPVSFYGSDTPRSRLPFSNYGSRLDVQGWGEMVVTTGYGTLHSSEGTNLLYDSSFAGTSSASPVVAAAVALVESRFEGLYAGSTVMPATMRSLLAATGSAQQAGTYPVSQKIGPLPDVQAAVGFAGQMLAGGTYSVGATGAYLNLTAVAAALNTRIVAGNVVFELQADYTGTAGETFPVVFLPFTTQGGNWRATVRPAAGVSMRTTGGSPPGGYPLVHFRGVDRLTFDGRPGGSGTAIAWTLRNMRKDSLAPTVQLSGGADRNVLTYLQIEGENTNASSATVLVGTSADRTGSRANTVSYSIVRDRTDLAGLSPANAVAAPAMETASSDSNLLQGNEIFNWSNAGVMVAGNWWTISGNSLYETVPQAGALTAILLFAGGGHLVSGNDIGGSAAGRGGGPLAHTGASAFTGVQLNVDTAGATSVQGNRIANIACQNAGGSSFMGILVAAGAADIGTVTRNVIGDSAAGLGVTLAGTGIAGGINISSPVPGRVNVVNNLIANVAQLAGSPGEFRAINVLGIRRASVRRNEIRAVGPVSAGATNAVYGIYAGGLNDTTLVANNMVALGEGTSTSAQYTGVCDAGLSGSTMPVDIFFNSVHIGGAAVGGAGSYAFRRDGGTQTRLQNNILSNMRTGGAAPHNALGMLGAPPAPGLSEYNVLFNANSAQLVSLLGGQMSLAVWRTASGCDLNSVNADPRFINPAAGNLHIDPTVYSPADNGGVAQPSVTDDLDGQPRGPAPDIGADEYAINPPAPFALLAPSNGANGRPVNGVLVWQTSAAAGEYDLRLDTLTPPTAVVAASLPDTSYAYAGLDTNRTYYWSVTAKNSSGSAAASGGASWAFTTGPGGGGFVTMTCTLSAGWNLLSVPVEAPDPRAGALFPSAATRAFFYEGSYVEHDTLGHCVGYWLKFDSAENVDIGGNACFDDSIGVSGGWNMIGALSSAIPFSGLTSSPPGITTSNLFGYDGTSYTVADSLRPGRGYWVKVSQAGTLFLKTPAAAQAGRIRIMPDGEEPPAPPAGGRETGLAASPPADFRLEQNWPNPFNPSTRISFDLPRATRATLKVFTLLGTEVATLLDGPLAAGRHELRFEAGDLPSGLYLYRIVAGEFSATRKFVLVR